jgi:hypothetical protein
MLYYYIYLIFDIHSKITVVIFVFLGENKVGEPPEGSEKKSGLLPVKKIINGYFCTSVFSIYILLPESVLRIS